MAATGKWRAVIGKLARAPKCRADDDSTPLPCSKPEQEAVDYDFGVDLFSRQ